MTSVPELVAEIVAAQRAATPGRVPLVGVAGAQGSGKTYACRQLVAADASLAHFSLDDVYFTKAERERLARRFHPLFATRGPPGTHAVGVALSVFAALRAAAPDTVTPIPRFDKASDDRAPEPEWPRFRGRPSAILFDGWCLGALPDELGDAPLNRLEAEEDPDGRWRKMIREDLGGRYRQFFAGFDAIVYLRPPSWEIVRSWRRQQEEETLGRPLSPADDARLDRFLQHYERITRSMMAGAALAHVVADLDEERRVTRVGKTANPPTSPP